LLGSQGQGDLDVNARLRNTDERIGVPFPLL